MTREEARRRLAAQVGPVRLDLSNLNPSDVEAPSPRRELVRGTLPGRLGRSLVLASLLALVVAAEVAGWWLQEWLQDHIPVAVWLGGAGLVAAVALVCFVYIEVTRRRARPRILP